MALTASSPPGDGATGPSCSSFTAGEGRGAQLGAFVEPLVDAGMSVVTFDAPAHGASPGSRLYLTDHADCVIDAVAAIGPVHAIVAHSFGAAAVLLAHARGCVDVPHNVMVAPNAVVDDAVERFGSVLGLDARDQATLEEQLAAQTGLGFDSLRLEHLVGHRSTALTVIHDRGDREVPFADGARLAAVWPEARLIATESLGHRRILRDPAVVAAVVSAASEGLHAADL